MKSQHKINYLFTTLVVLVSAFGGFLFGYDWIVVGGARLFYEPFFEITESPVLQAVAMSSSVVGCMIGAIFAGVIADKRGRKTPLIVAAALFTLSAIGTGMADSFSVFIIYRLIGGFATAMGMVLSPIYIAEIAPAQFRGRFVAINQLTIVLGILLARLINIYIAKEGLSEVAPLGGLLSWNEQTGWRWMFWVEALFTSVFFLSAFAIPESPRWLVKEHKVDQATRVLTRIGGGQYAKECVAEIAESVKETADHKRIDWSFLRKRKTKTIVVIGLLVAMFQQFCGINVIFDYSEQIFSEAGYGDGDIIFNITVVGLVNVAFTLIGLRVIDTWGRRKLMLIGYGVLSILFLLLGSFYYMEFTGIIMLVCVLIGIGVFAMTLGPATWVVLSEIFPNRVRGVAMSMATFGIWSGGFILTYTFPLIAEALGTSGTFWAYAVICMLAYVFVLEYLPETNGKSLEEIETLFDKYEENHYDD